MDKKEQAAVKAPGLPASVRVRFVRVRLATGALEGLVASLIVEVLSKSSRRRDETLKRMAYQTIPTRKEYVLSEQDIVDVEFCRGSEGWVSNHYFMGDEVTFASIGLTFPVEGICARVEDEDVRTYFKEKEATYPRLFELLYCIRFYERN